MTTRYVTLEMENLTSSEGIHEIIECLEKIAEDLKGGYENGSINTKPWILTYHD